MNSKKPILCSACLLGINCRYDGKIKPNDKVLALAKNKILIPVCPEQLGGLKTPRLGAEIIDGKVLTENGVDVTDEFKRGAEEVLKISKLLNIDKAILKERSPSCGSKQIYDGSFSGRIVSGAGITAQLLAKKGIEIISEEEL